VDVGLGTNAIRRSQQSQKCKDQRRHCFYDSSARPLTFWPQNKWVARIYRGTFVYVKVWLPVRRRVKFKLACLVHQSFAGQTPAYLASDIQLIADTDRHQRPSVSERMCVVPRTHNSFGDRSFSVAGPRVWNALPSYLWQDTSYRHFKQSLKGHMFRP